MEMKTMGAALLGVATQVKLKRSKIEMKTMGAALLGVATQGQVIEQAMHEKVGRTVTCVALQRVFRH
ncbi:hypothetical protein Tco_1530487 [Tanacetum coccineum]